MSEPVIVRTETAQPTTDVSATAAAAPAPLGRAAATGFLLMSGQSLLTRAMTLAAQVVVARWLTPAEFGLFAIAMAVMRFSELSQQVGVREVVVSRQKRFHLWQNAAWWIANVAGVVAALATAIAAPIMAWVYGEPSLLWMLLILALAQPLYNVTLVQEARLQIDMRFKRIAAGQFLQGALMPASQAGFAIARFGAYALVVPRLIVGVARWWFYRRAAPIEVRRDPQVRLWKYILLPGLLVPATNPVYNIRSCGPALLPGGGGGGGSRLGQAFAGHFGFAFNLSLQSVMLLSMQIDSILFPTLGKMAGDPVRQRAAFLRAGHALAAVMAPVCLFQIAAARPLILLVFGAKWEPAVVPFQVMSVGMLFAGAFAPAQSLLQAQARFGKKLFIALLWGVVSGVVSAVGILLAPEIQKGEAAAVGLAGGVIGDGVAGWISAARPVGGDAADVARVLTMPCMVGLLAMAIAMGADAYATPAAAGALGRIAAWVVTLAPERFEVGHVRDMLTHAFRIGLLGVVGGVSFLGLLRTLAPGVWKDMVQAAHPISRRLAPYLSRLHGRPAGGGGLRAR